jgi:hypothetical protein
LIIAIITNRLPYGGCSIYIDYIGLHLFVIIMNT